MNSTSGVIGRGDVEILNNIVHPLGIFLYLIPEKGKFGDDACLVSYPLPESFPYFLFVYVQLGKQGGTIFHQQHADVNTGKTEVRAHAHVSDRDEFLTDPASLIALENVAQFFQYQPGEFLLSYGAAHWVKVRKSWGIVDR